MAHDEQDQAALDGALSNEEISRFKESLGADPQAALRFEALKHVDSSLRSLPTSPPPPDLREGVMRQIRLQQALAPASKAVRSAWWDAWFPARPAFQVGLGFALGVLVLMPLMKLTPTSFVDPASVTGTLATRDELVGSPAGHLDIVGPGLSGSLSSIVEGGMLTLQFRLASAGPVEAALEFEAPLLGLYSIQTDSPWAGSVEYSGRKLTLHHAGTTGYTIRLAMAPGTSPRMDLGIYRSAEAIFEAAVP